ncbi:hypothetical protein KM043_011179 [Ampulex compressa]|nr:hypothetical protein KM043_011179 [Ampulex compressa]
MGRKKKCVEKNTNAENWLPTENSWMPSVPPMNSNSYYYSSPYYYLGYGTHESDLRYRHEYVDHRGPGQSHRGGVNRMANIVPWLLSMSLLGVQEFAANAGPHVPHRELRAPALSNSPPVSSSGFASSVGIYKTLISTHEEFPGHITCDTPNQGNSLERKIPGAPEYGNYLYGSTPDSSEYFGGSFESSGITPRTFASDIESYKADPHSVNQLENRRFHYGIGQGNVEDDYVGPAMELVYAWPTIDYEFESIEARDFAIFDGEYIAENNLPLGLDIWRDKVFITLPKWKPGIPATLATVPKNSKTKSPKLKPYPNWEWNRADNCDRLVSVFRIHVDECDRLWVLDSGKTELAKMPKQVCPPALYIFNLQNDSLIRKYVLPDDYIKQDSLYSNIVVDIRNNECSSAVAYLSDVWRFGIVVYDYAMNTSHRVDHHFFYPEPLASKYELHGMKFHWTDGIFGIALSPIDVNGDRTLFFHPMSSFREFAVPTSVLRDKRSLQKNVERFTPIGRPRAKDYGHSSGSVIDKHGVMFFNMATRDSVWCWDTRKEYIPQNLGVLGASNVSLVFPNDIKVDHEYDQNVWLTTNRLPMYLYGTMDTSKVNYRVFKANIKKAIANTVCDPNYIVPDSDQGYDHVC